MKYFIDTEFIEGFRKPLFGKRRHFIDLISIGIVCEDGRNYYAVSSEYKYNDADNWVKENVIQPMYIDAIHGDMRNHVSADNFQHHIGLPNSRIAEEVLGFFGCWRDAHFYRAPDDIEVYGYYSDYDWVLFCSLFGRMIDLPKGFPMYCIDLKQSLDEICKYNDYGYEHQIVNKWSQMPFEDRLKYVKSLPRFPHQEIEHNALDDAKWNLELHKFLRSI